MLNLYLLKRGVPIMINRPSTHDFSEYLKENFKNHSHLKIAILFCECMDYIQENMAEIKSKAGKTTVLDHRGLIFNFNGLNTPEEIENHFTQLNTELHACIDGLLSIENRDIRNQVIDIFLDHINNSAIASMEIRLRNAIIFYDVYQRVGLISFNNIMQAFYEQYDSVNHKNITAANILKFFADKVNSHLLVVTDFNQTEPLTWPLILNHLEKKPGLDNIRHEWMRFTENSPYVITSDKWQVKHLYFDSEQAGNNYLSYIKSILPDIDSVKILTVPEKEISSRKYYCILTEPQYKKLKYILNNYRQPSSINTIDESKEKVPEIETEEEFISRNADDHALYIADNMRAYGALVKSVRWDNHCFNADFIEGVTKSPVSRLKPKKYSRLGPHKQFSANAAGPYERSKRLHSPYAPLSPEEIAEKKKILSAFQSTSLVTPEAQIPVFGHNRDRADKLVGYLFDPNDALINRMFIYDGGTALRPYEFDTYQEALAYFNKKTNPDHPFLFASMEEFEKAIANHKDKYNEVLARIKWNVNSSAVGIYSDTFEARCIAQFYATQMRDRLKMQYQELNIPWDESYVVPIIYYIPGSVKNWLPYTQKEQLADREEANRIFRDAELQKKAFARGNYEFMLLLDHPLDVFKFTYKKGDKERLYMQYLLENGELHLIESLIYKIKVEEDIILKYFDHTANYQKYRDKHGNTCFHLSAEFNFLTSLKIMLASKSANVNVVNAAGQTPLMLAAYKNNLEIMKLLLAHPDIEVNIVDKTGSSALITAAYNNHPAAVRMLLSDSRVNIHTANNHGNTAFLMAVAHGNIELINIFLNDKRLNSDSINVINSSGSGALAIAIKRNNLEILQTLLADSRFNVNCVNKDKDTALLWAVKNNNTEIAKLILADQRLDVNAVNANGDTAFLWAAYLGNIELINLLLNDKRMNDDSVSFLNSAGEGVLTLSSANGHTEATKLFLADLRLNVNAVNKHGSTALLTAIDSNHPENAKILLADRRVDISIPSNQGNTAFLCAAFHGNIELLNIIIKHEQFNADSVNAINKAGNGALILAAKHGHVETVNLLLDQPLVNVNVVDQDGNSLLIWAIVKNHIDIAKKILANPQVNVNYTDRDGNTALMLAASWNHEILVKILLAHQHIDVDITNDSGNTAFQFAKNDKIKDLFITARLKKYIKELKERKDEYKPAYPVMSKLTMGFFGGYGKSEKLSALYELAKAKKTKTKITNKTTINILNDGELGKIIEGYSPDKKRKLGL